MIPLVFLTLSFSQASKASIVDARDALLQENYYQAENILNAIEHHGASPALIALYRGTIAQAMGHHSDAEHLFQLALAESESELIQKEIVLSLGLNALMQSDVEKMELAISLGKKALSFSSHFLLLEGIVNYSKNDYNNAITSLLAYQEALKTHENLYWIDDLFAKFFPQSIVELYLAHAYIETGEFEKGREIVKQSPLDEAYSLLGSSYLIEAWTLPKEERESFYALAGFYLDKSPKFLLFSKQKMILEVEKTIVDLGFAKQETLPLLTLLEKWKNKEALARLAAELAIDLSGEKDFPRINKESFPIFFSCMSKEVISLLKMIPHGDFPVVWGKIIALEIDVDAVSNQLQEEVLNTIATDDEKLHTSFKILKVWEQLEKNPAKRNTLAYELAHQGKLLWLKSGEEKKGTRLLKAATALLGEKEREEFARCNLHFFENLYTQAERSNMIKRLLIIHEALGILGLELPTPPHPSTVGNYLADAEYHFNARNYGSSMMHAELIMKMEPGNEEALRIFGLSLYHMGEYQRAMNALSKLCLTDDYAERALMLCIAHAKVEKEKHLVQVDTLDSLSEDN